MADIKDLTRKRREKLLQAMAEDKQKGAKGGAGCQKPPQQTCGASTHTEDPKEALINELLEDEAFWRYFRAQQYGMGALYARLQRGRFLHVTKTGEWFVFNGNHWELDELNRHKAGVEDVIALLSKKFRELKERQATAEKDGDEQAAATLAGLAQTIKKRIKRLRKQTWRNMTLEFATSCRKPIAITGDEFDIAPYSLCCKNGVLDLRSGEIRPGRPDDYLTLCTNVPWKGIDAPRQRWEKMLSEVYEEREEVITYLQKLFGLALIGEVIEHMFVIFHGRGWNGKGVIMDTIAWVLGSHATAIPSEMFMDEGKNRRGADAASPSLMSLKGRRLAYGDETEDGRRISSAKVKWLTGGGNVVARNLHDKRLTEFAPSHSLFLLTNHKPHAPGTDFAFWERCRVIPHKLSYVLREPQKPWERRADPFLKKKLKEEGPGILAWMVEGCLRYQREGLKTPPYILEATGLYRSDENEIMDFLEACCELDPEAKTWAKDLYQVYSWWYKKNIGSEKHKVPTQRSMTKRIKELEICDFKKSHGLFRFIGLGIKAEVLAEMRAFMDDAAGYEGQGGFG